MSKIRRVLQLLHDARLSQRETARATGVSKTSVSEIASCARAAGMTWAQARELDDQTLHARLYPPPVARSSRHLEPDWAQLHQQLKRPGVTLQLLWEEYQLAHEGRAYKYSAFCEKYARFARLLVRWQMEHRPHPEQGYRACLGLMRLSREYGTERLEAACARALSIRAPLYKSISSILAAGLDRQGALGQPELPAMPAHENVRGPGYYH